MAEIEPVVAGLICMRFETRVGRTWKVFFFLLFFFYFFQIRPREAHSARDELPIIIR